MTDLPTKPPDPIVTQTEVGRRRYDIEHDIDASPRVELTAQGLLTLTLLRWQWTGQDPADPDSGCIVSRYRVGGRETFHPHQIVSVVSTPERAGARMRVVGGGDFIDVWEDAEKVLETWARAFQPRDRKR